MENHVAPMADDLRTDLEQLLTQAGLRAQLRDLRHRVADRPVAGIVRAGITGAELRCGPRNDSRRAPRRGQQLALTPRRTRNLPLPNTPEGATLPLICSTIRRMSAQRGTA